MLTTRSRNMVGDMSRKIQKQLEVQNLKQMYQRMGDMFKEQDP